MSRFSPHFELWHEKYIEKGKGWLVTHIWKHADITIEVNKVEPESCLKAGR